MRLLCLKTTQWSVCCIVKREGKAHTEKNSSQGVLEKGRPKWVLRNSQVKRKDKRLESGGSLLCRRRGRKEWAMIQADLDPSLCLCVRTLLAI